MMLPMIEKNEEGQKTHPKKSRCLNLATTTFANEVAVKHDAEKKNCIKNARKVRFEEIVNEVCAIRNVPSSIAVKKQTIE